MSLWVVVRGGGKHYSAPRTKEEAKAFKNRMKRRYPWLTFEVRKLNSEQER